MSNQDRLNTLDLTTRERIARHVKGLDLYVLDFEDYGNNIVRFCVRTDREQDDINMFVSAMLDLAGLKDYQIRFVGCDKMQISFTGKGDSEFALSIMEKNI